jgi:hypothetical protein
MPVEPAPGGYVVTIPAGTKVLSVSETVGLDSTGNNVRGENVRVQTPSGGITTVFVPYGPDMPADAAVLIGEQVAQVEAIYGLSNP